MDKKRISLIAAMAVVLLAVSVGTTYLCLASITRHTSAAAATDWAQALDLSSDQKKKLTASETSLNAELKPVRSQLVEAQMALCQLLHDANADDAKVEQAIQKIGELRTTEERRVARHMIAVQQFLTPAQKDKFASTLMAAVCDGHRRAVGNDQEVCAMCQPQTKK